MNSNNYNCLVKLAAPTQPQYTIPAPPPPPIPDDLIRIQAYEPTLALARRQPITSVPYPQPRNSFGDRIRDTWSTLSRYNPARRLSRAISGVNAGTAGATMPTATAAPVNATPSSLNNQSVNPATGGTRIMYKGQPIGPVESNHKMRKGLLPITPYSSGKININSMQQAAQQADAINGSRRVNDEWGKKKNAQNLDVMFKRLHQVNQARRAAGLPDYTPSDMDIYAPYAHSKTDYADAENRIQNDITLSTIAQEAARRGTPLNEIELTSLDLLTPATAQERQRRLNLADQYPEYYMGGILPKQIHPDRIGETANGVY